MHLIIIHGTEGNPTENWFPWLKERGEQTGWKVTAPRLPTPTDQTLARWKVAFGEQVGALTADTLLVGHSLGAVFILRLLESAEIPVAGAYLLSSPTGHLGIPAFDSLNASFTEGGFNWPLIRDRSERFVVWMGDDDPYVPREQGETIAEHLGVPLGLIPQGGHLNTAAGFTSFPALWEDIQQNYA